MEYLTSVQTAEKWGLTKRMVNSLCQKERVAGAYKDGYRWMIPADAVRPGTDKRGKIYKKVGNQNTIREWFEAKQKGNDFSKLYEAICDGQSDQMERFLNRQLEESISYYDSAEQFYHGYMLGVLSGMNGCEIQSNKEQVDGRPDLVIKPFSPKQPAIVIELKRAASFARMEQMCDRALQQIEEKQYTRELLDEGYQKLLKYGICFCKKHCVVKMAVEA